MIWWIEQTFLVTAIMAAAAWGICRWKRVPAKLRHLLWLAVIIKLLLPPVVAWPWALGAAGRADSTTVHTEASGTTMMAHLKHWLTLEDEPAGQQTAAGSVAARDAGAPASAPPAPQNNAALPHPPGAARSPARLTSPDHETPWQLTPGHLRRWLAAVWIAGAVSLFLSQLARIVRLARRVRAAEPASAALEQELQQLARQMKVRTIPARQLAGLDGPYIWSLARPLLLWPADMPIDAAARGLIVHELAHVKRRDHWVGWLELAAGIVWWWNPVYHTARRHLRANAELCCDAAVAAHSPGERRQYAESLLAVCARAAGARMPAAVLGVKSAKRELAERLSAIMTAPAPRRLPIAAWASLMALIAAALPAFAQSATAPDKLPFTISKETTAITAPLKPDGTPDYVQALNDKYGQGVTPENNGYTLWLESFGGKDSGALPASWYEKILQTAGAKTPPANRTFLPYQTFLKDVKKIDPNDPASMQKLGAMDVLYEHPWQAEDNPDAAEYLTQIDADIDQAAAIAARAKWWMPSIVGSGQIAPFKDGVLGVLNDSAISMMLPSLVQVREMSNLLCTRAMRRAGAGDVDGALRDLLAAKRYARHMNHGPTLIEDLLGAAIDRRANATLAGWAAAGKLSSPQCRAIQQAIDALPPMGDSIESLDVGERWVQLDEMVLAAMRPGVFRALKALYTGDPDADSDKDLSFSAFDREAVDWDYVLREVNRMWDDIVATAKLPTDAQRMERSSAFEKRQHAWVVQFNLEPTLKRQPGETRQAYSQRVVDAVEGIFVITVSSAIRIAHESTMTADMARILLAAADTKARTGSWPKNAAEIKSPLLAQTPLDMYSAQGMGSEPLKYLLTAGGPMVYSVGPNYKDDGGVRDYARKMDDIPLPAQPAPATAPAGLP